MRPVDALVGEAGAADVAGWGFGLARHASSGYGGPLVTAFAFGASAELTRCRALGRNGSKRATAGLLKAFETEGDPLPRVDDRCLVLGGDGRPLAAHSRFFTSQCRAMSLPFSTTPTWSMSGLNWSGPAAEPSGQCPGRGHAKLNIGGTASKTNEAHAP